MLKKSKWYLICRTIFIIFLCADNTHAARTRRNIGVVQNLTINAYEDVIRMEDDSVHRSLKLNVSWSPPNGERQPSSYSVIVTGVSKEEDVECPKESLLYISPNGSEHNVSLPQNNHLSDMPVLPRCSYKVQVHANPRLSAALKSPEVIYTVPECIEHTCSCTDAKSLLPIPTVNVIQQEDNVEIQWNVSGHPDIQSYVIRIGVPLLTSQAGLPVYNITSIANVTAQTSTLLWDRNSEAKYFHLKNGDKIFVNARDDRGCLGEDGTFIVNFSQGDSTNVENLIWAITIALIVTCIVLGIFIILSIQLKKRYQLVLTPKPSGIQAVKVISKYNSQWLESLLEIHNVLYIQQEIEETYNHENDHSEVPYKNVKLIHELGKGQFGKVYLGTLDDHQKTLVAVKMSQSSDTSDKSEARQQFLEEINIMRSVGSHPNLVRLLGYCTLPTKPVCIILEYMQGGDLLAYLKSRRDHEKKENTYHTTATSDQVSRPSISETLYTTLSSRISSVSSYISTKLSLQYNELEQLPPRYVNTERKNRETESEEKSYGQIERSRFMKFSLDIARGMEHLEAKGITHRDLAARNILLTSDLTLKISDFGLSRNGIYVISNVAGKVHHLPIRWMSPEALHDRAFSAKSDVWSFAIVLWEIGTLGSFPYPNVSDDKLLHHIIRDGGRLERPDGVSHDVYKLMCLCWASQPQDRPSFKEIVGDLEILNEPQLNSTSNPCYTLLSNYNYDL